MKSEDLFNTLTDIDDSILSESENYQFNKRRSRIIPVAISAAAAFILIAGLAAISFNTDFIDLFGDFPSSETIAPDSNYFPGELTTAEEASLNGAVEDNTRPFVSEPASDEHSSGNPHITPGSKETKPAALTEAKYPEMAKFPDAVPIYGSEYNKQYDAWNADVREMNSVKIDNSYFADFSSKVLPVIMNGENDKNKAVSPISLYMALAMLAETAGGDSREQLLSVLGADSIEQLRENSSSVWLKNYRDDGKMKSILAASLWLNDTVDFNSDTVNRISSNYYASVYKGTMGSDSFNKLLNKWINKQTDNMLNPQIQMNSNTVMNIVSTILFKTKWQDEFSEDATEKSVFFSPSGEKTADFMKSTRQMYYYWNDSFSAVSLPLDIGGSMWFILPDEDVDADTLFLYDDVVALVTGSESAVDSTFIRVNLSIPKFDISCEKDLMKDVKKLGVTDVADPLKSDFSPLAKNYEGIFVNKINHTVRVKIDEEGVAAAAYTALELCGSAAPPEDEVDFVLSRPFAFVINLTGAAPLFAGIVNEIS